MVGKNVRIILNSNFIFVNMRREIEIICLFIDFIFLGVFLMSRFIVSITNEQTFLKFLSVNVESIIYWALATHQW